ncbi:MAG: WD40 repeat domain-containing protein [Thermoguttaceae bacterium]
MLDDSRWGRKSVAAGLIVFAVACSGWPIAETASRVWANSPELFIQSGYVRSRASLASSSLDASVPLDKDAIESLSFARDRPFMATCADGCVVIWNADTAQEIRRFDGCEGFALSLDGKRVATSCLDGHVAIWETETGRKLASLAPSAKGTRLVFSTDGRWLAAGKGESPVAFSPDDAQLAYGRCGGVVWDASTGKMLMQFPGDSTKPGTRGVLIGDVRTGKVVRELKGQWNDGANGVVFSGDGTKLATLSVERVAVVWDSKTGKRLREFSLADNDDEVTSMCFSPDGSKIATGAFEKKVVVWDINSGEQLSSFEGCSGPVRCVAFSSDGARLAGGSSGGSLVIWDIRTQKVVLSFSGRAYRTSTVAVSSDGNLIGLGSEDDTASIFDLRTGKKVSSFRGNGGGRPSNNWPAGLSGLRFGPKHKVATSISGGNLSVWDVRTGRLLHLIDTGATSVLSVNFKDADHATTFSLLHGLSPGKEKATLNATEWDITKAKELRNSSLQTEGDMWSAFCAAFSPDGGKCVAGGRSGGIAGGKGARLVAWDVQSGKTIWEHHDFPGVVLSTAFSSDGTRVLTGDDHGMAVLWDGRTGRKLRSLESPELGWVRSVAFLPEGNRAIMACGRIPILWDTESGRKLREFRGHSGTVTAVAVCPDATLLLSGATDGTAIVWRLATGERLATLMCLDGGQNWVAFTPDGDYDGSEGGRRLVTYRLSDGITIVPGARMAKAHYRPGLLSVRRQVSK